MTSNRVTDITRYSFNSTDQLFVDTNVWLTVYGPPGMTYGRITRVYSNALQRIIQSGAFVYVDVLVLSEFVNAYARFEYKTSSQYQGSSGFKRFRQSPSFQVIAKSIANSVRRILKHVQRIETMFTNIDVNTLMTDFESGKYDFNDQVIVQLCIGQKLTLVTHDADFARESIPILTANRKLIASATST